MQTQWSKTANFYTPPVFNAHSQRELSEFMRGFYITEIYGHDSSGYSLRLDLGQSGASI